MSVARASFLAEMAARTCENWLSVPDSKMFTVVTASRVHWI